MTGRTSIAVYWASGILGGQLAGPLGGLALDHVVAGQELLGLHVRTVGHRRHAVAHAHRGAVGGVGEGREADQLARVLGRGLEGVVRAEDSVALLLRQGLEHLRVHVDHEQVLHVVTPRLRHPVRAPVIGDVGAGGDVSTRTPALRA
jgi:hypothetical protein